MKLNQGDVLVCDPGAGCGLKVVVIEVCEETQCDLTCCGKQMLVAQKTSEPDAWKQYAREPQPEPEVWKKHAKTKKE